MDEEGKPPRFWLHAGHRRSSSNFNTSTLFMLIVPTAALLLLLFTFSSVPSLSSQILNPNSVKKTWDSLNLLLVLFAIFCGTFARWNEDDGGSTESRDQVSNDHPPQQPSSHQLKWYELSSYDSSMRATTSGRGGLRRSSSSYPDLRQQSNWETTGEHGFRYYDDFEIARINQLLKIQPEGIVGQGRLRINADPDAKLNSYPSKQDSEARPASSRANPPSSPPPPLSLRQKKTRAHRSVPRIERLGIQNAAGTAHKLPQIENKEEIRHSLETGLRSQAKAGRRRRPKDVPGKDGGRQKSSVAICTSPPSPPVDVTSPLKDEYSLHHPQDPKVKLTVPKQKTETESETQAVPSPPPRLLPPPPPIPPSTIWRPEQAVKKEGKKSSAKREIAMVWASIYKRKKKQNQPEQPQQLGREDAGNYNGISELFCEPEFSSTTQLCPHPSPPPPPPPLPPPPHSVLHSFFRKTGSKKIHSVPAPPPPPPRLPRQSFITQVTPRPRSSAGKPPLPKRQSSYRKDEYRYASSSGSESPVADIPRPPPLPPFGVPETRFAVRGGLARMGKNSSWRSEEIEELSEFEGESLAMEWSGGEADVNAKAETFIARLRGEWRLEKMNDT
uniref:Uncharacterized protein n=1 Tax=Kalanchoe fedtschenkoi TaxID=63787 RepID=A0A7N0TUQ2_KALFE